MDKEFIYQDREKQFNNVIEFLSDEYADDESLKGWLLELKRLNREILSLRNE